MIETQDDIIKFSKAGLTCAFNECYPACCPKKASKLYNYIRLHNEDDMLEVDREHTCSWDTADPKFNNFKWEK